MNTTILKCYRLSILCLVLLSTFSCTKDSLTSEKSATIDSIRPYSPWVFRSVLDERPRMLTMALHEDLYAAYSTINGTLYKVWDGNVLFEGAVYNSAHGPQPLSVGNAYFINKYENPWIITKDNEEVDFVFKYRGHQFTDADHADLHYEFLVDGHVLKVSETPEATKPVPGSVDFTRKFTTSDVPAGYSISIKTNASSMMKEENLTTDGELEVVKKAVRTGGDIDVHEIDGTLALKSNGTTSISCILSKLSLIENPNNSLVSAAELEGNEGKDLIGKNDCKSCHNTYVKTIGPSYTAIAKKYRTSDDNVLYLANKILKGGKGVWGNVPMTAHPELSKEDASTMVKYILDLDEEDEGNGEKDMDVAMSEYLSPASLESDGFIPGALVKVYDISKTTNSMPDYSAMKPMMGGVLANFDNLSDSDFQGLDSNFGLTGEGYFEIPEDQEYLFRIWSDDGSKLYINDKLVVDNDGNHGTEYKENKVGLKKGYHKFRLDFYQGAGGKFLSLNWKPKGNEVFEVIPTSFIVHGPLRHSEITGLTLPMSSSTKIPGNGCPLESSHPSFTISAMRPEGFLPKVGGLDVLADGRVILSTWDTDGSVYIVDARNAKNPEEISYKKIASGLAEPLGVKVVDGDIYVMQKQEMTQLIDHNGDEIIDEYRTLNNDWAVSANFHEFGFGLEGKEDYLYATLAIGIMPGGASAVNQPKDRGKVIRVNRKTGEIEYIAHGLRTPNGIGLGFNDEIYVADNQGDWLPASKILHVSPDAFYNSRAVNFEATAKIPVKQPVVWLPQDEVGNSPSTPAKLNVGPYKNQMIHGEVTHGGLKRVFVEEVEGELQGALFRFSQGFEAGVNRISWVDDKTLIVGGIGNPGNWQHSGRKWYGLQKFSYNGNPTFEMLAIRAKTNGLEIEFTEALKIGDGWNPSSYAVNQYYYKPTVEYGGPKLGEQELSVQSATVSDDRKRVFLEIPGIKEKHVVYLKLMDYFVSEKENDLWTTESWYTMNQIPQNSLGQAQKAPTKLAHNTLSDAEKAAGWSLLFDGETTTNWRNFKKETIGSSWKVEEGVLFLDSQKKDTGGWQAADGGDIITDKAYEDYEFSLEWKISNCGNSGIIYNVVESEEHGYVWQTGPEMQILDNTCHPDTKYATHRAGDLYDMIETKYVTVKPAGEWNKIRLINKNGKIQHWQNGYKVVEYDMNSEEWPEMIKYSKFKDMAAFGKSASGHISLQDHGDPVFFRNIKIREL